MLAASKVVHAPRAGTRGALRRAIVAAAVLSATACGGSTPASVADVRPLADGILTAADVADASAEADLHLTGALGVTNAPGGLHLTTAQLEQLPTVEVELSEPFEQRRIRFSGVRVADLLDFVDAGEGATALDLVAHDDYAVTLDIAALRDDEAVLATREAGDPIDLAAGGPIRLVFPDGSATGANPDLWIWSVRDIDIR